MLQCRYKITLSTSHLFAKYLNVHACLGIYFELVGDVMKEFECEFFAIEVDFGIIFEMSFIVDERVVGIDLYFAGLAIGLVKEVVEGKFDFD